MVSSTIGNFEMAKKRLTAAECKAEIEKSIQLFCSNSESLSRSDLKCAVIYLLGFKPTTFEIDQIMSGRDSLPKEQFADLMVIRLQHEDFDEHIRQVFNAFDFNGRGFLTIEDVQRAFQEVAPHVLPAQVSQIFSELDTVGNGKIGYAEFHRMMATPAHFISS